MKEKYSYSVLRYIHDPITEEFVNVGVALYSGDAKFLKALCTHNYGRITRMFTRIEGDRYRQLINYIESKVNAIGNDLPSKLPFEPGLAIEALLAKILPRDDSSIQFSPAGVGLSTDLERTLGELYERYVEQYSRAGDSDRRTDEEVWKVFRQPLERRDIASKLIPKKIVAPDYEYEFQHSWKNRSWHVCEPVSFDLIEASSMLEKANRWVGRATILSESKEEFKIHVLLGEPQDKKLRGTFIKAQNILHKMPAKKEFVSEGDAEQFADHLKSEMDHESE
jgi:hypothetical protein